MTATWQDVRAEIEQDWVLWVAAMFPGYTRYPFASHHEEIWEWLWALRPGQPADEACVAIVGRGGAKSTTAEAGVAACGARQTRRYCLFVSDTQDQADDHVGNVGSMLESPRVEAIYPAMGTRLVGKYGNSKGWRRNRLRTSTGFTVDAIGLDTASRGIKLEEQRPDLIVLDDIDRSTDTALATRRKVDIITKGLLPAGSSDVAVLAIQNLVHPDGVFARLSGHAEEPADFLARRKVIGPIPAVYGLETVTEQGPTGPRTRIVRGTPSWAGQDLAVCQKQIDEWGISAFLSEAQHDVRPPQGGVFSHLTFRRCDWEEVPDPVRGCVAVDPAVTNTDQSDRQGIQADLLAADGTVYRVHSWEGRTSPLDAICRAVRTALDLGVDRVIVETDQGGDTWESVYREACDLVRWEWASDGLRHYQDAVMPTFRGVKAGAVGTKVERAQQMAAGYETGPGIVHVRGSGCETLEAALHRFPAVKPFDLTDAAFWSWRELVQPKAGRKLRFRR